MNKAIKVALGVIALMVVGILLGLLLIGFSVVAQGAQAPAVVPAVALCETDSDCATKFPGTYGDPEPVCAGLDCTVMPEPSVGGFLQCPEPDVSEPVMAPNGALMKFS